MPVYTPSFVPPLLSTTGKWRDASAVSRDGSPLPPPPHGAVWCVHSGRETHGRPSTTTLGPLPQESPRYAGYALAHVVSLQYLPQSSATHRKPAALEATPPAY